MMVIEVHIDPGGDRKRRKTVERIYVGNASDLAAWSDYRVWDGVHPHEAEAPDAYVDHHYRPDGALALTERVCRAVVRARRLESEQVAS
jgi:hypothetical protein